LHLVGILFPHINEDARSKSRQSVFSVQLENVEYFKKKTFHWQSGHKFKEETSKMLHLEYSFVWCRNLDT